MKTTAPLILTLALDERSFAFFDEQRRRYFPPDRNFIPAHLTLFHHLPGQHADSIEDLLREQCARQHDFTVDVTGLRLLGRGVAYGLHSPVLAELHRSLAAQWASWLTPQDRQNLQPHVTVQNKVEPHKARELQLALAETFRPFEATATGLELWWYRGGPWEKLNRFPFVGS